MLRLPHAARTEQRALLRDASPRTGIEHEKRQSAKSYCHMQLERFRNKTETIDATGAVGS